MTAPPPSAPFSPPPKHRQSSETGTESEDDPSLHSSRPSSPTGPSSSLVIMERGEMDEEREEEEAGVMSDKGSKLTSRFRKKLRRSAGPAEPSLLRFKRVKRHKLQQRVPPSFSSTQEDLYNPEAEGQRYFRLSAYCVCESINLSTIIEMFEEEETFSGKLILYQNVLELKEKTSHRHVFIFNYGSLVFFNYSETKELELLRRVRKACMKPYYKYEIEDFDFSYSAEFMLKNDEFCFETRSSLEKLSVAFALAQCVKLSIYEERVDEMIEANKHLPQALAATGHIPLSQNDIAKKIGSLFVTRNEINLHSDLLDQPEALWEDDRYMRAYEKTKKYLELEKRTGLLNVRLDVVGELMRVLSESLEAEHASKLELIIIYLIILEVVVMIGWNIIVKDVMGYFPRSDDD